MSAGANAGLEGARLALFCCALQQAGLSLGLAVPGSVLAALTACEPADHFVLWLCCVQQCQGHLGGHISRALCPHSAKSGI